MTGRALERWLRYRIWGDSSRASRRKRRRGPARNWKYRAWIRSLPSAVSGCYGCEAAHTAQDGGMSMKSSDYSCIPLLPCEHRLYHRIGRREFEKFYEISCSEVVKMLNRVWFECGGLVK